MSRVINRELDAAVAQAVFGWEFTAPQTDGSVRVCDYCGRPWGYAIDIACNDDCTFSATMAAAWRVVEALQPRGWRFDLASFADGQWRAGFGNDCERYAAAEAPTAPEAICRAALAVLEKKQ